MKWAEYGKADIDHRDRMAEVVGKVFGLPHPKNFSLAGRIMNNNSNIQPEAIMCCLARLDYRIKHPNDLEQVDTHEHRIGYLQKCINNFQAGNTPATGGDSIAWNDGPDAFDRYYHMVVPEKKNEDRYVADFNTLKDLLGLK